MEEPPPVFACRFAVDRKMFCVWDANPKDRTLEFLAGLDAGYFEYIVSRLQDDLSGNNGGRAALALRLAYGQASEALLALILAMLQAPDCPWAWLLKYKNSDIETLVAKVSRRERFPVKWTLRERSWAEVSELVHSHIVSTDPDAAAISTSFAKFWQRVATDLLDQSVKSEYNGLKHAFRLTSGGFTMRIADYLPFGQEREPSGMTQLTHSKFGTSFQVAEPIDGSSNNFVVRRIHRNWKAESLVGRTRLIYMSLANVVAALQVVNGREVQTVQFRWPKDLNVFDRVWDGAFLGEASLENKIVLRPEDLFSRERIAEVYQRWQSDDVPDTD